RHTRSYGDWSSDVCSSDLLDKEDRNLLVANPGSGTVAVLPVGADGRLGEASDVVQAGGNGRDPGRPAGSHPQGVALDPANRFARSEERREGKRVERGARRA